MPTPADHTVPPTQPAPTVTPTPEPAETPTESPTEPTATASPTPTNTPTVAPTPSPQPTATATPVPAPNLLFSVAVGGDLPVLNLPFQLLATVENEGPGTAFDVTFDVPLPAGLSFVELLPGAGGVDCAVTAGTLTCTVDEIAAGESVSVNLLMVMIGEGTGLTLEFTLPGTGEQEPIVVSLPLDVASPGLLLTAQFLDDANQPVPAVRYLVENTGGIALESLAIDDAGCAAAVPVDAAQAGASLLPAETREFVCETFPAAEYEGSATATAAEVAGRLFRKRRATSWTCCPLHCAANGESRRSARTWRRDRCAIGHHEREWRVAYDRECPRF